VEQLTFNYYKLPEKQNLSLPQQDSTQILLLGKSTEKKNEDFIQKVLEARNFDTPLDAITYVEFTEGIPFRMIAKSYPQLKAVISFGWSFADWQLQIDPSLKKIISIQDIILLLAPSIELIQKDKNLKLKFWEDLKSIAL
jgi:hypothetical protein